MSTLRPTRWTNPGLPQTLQFSVFLLYAVAASAVISRVVNFGGPTPYYLLGLKIFGVHVSADGRVTVGGAAVLELAAIVGLVYSAAMIASGRKLGWQLGVGLAAGMVIIPPLVLGASVVSTDYLIDWAFDIALFALLAHPQSREHQRIWFD